MNVIVTYFKSSGKYYTHADWEVDDRLLHHHVVSKLRGLAMNGGPRALPGIQGEGWDGFVHLQIGNVPHLLDLRGSRSEVRL